MRMILATATLKWEKWAACIESWQSLSVGGRIPLMYVMDKTIIDAYNMILEAAKEVKFDVIAYVHDDLVCHEPNWDARIEKEHADPKVGVVGVAGALGHGRPELYKVPFEIPQLARQGFLSNIRTAEQHGRRFTGECDVTVLDGMALFVRRSLLEKIGGWKHGKAGYYLYAETLACLARRNGYRLRLVGIDCDHLGGKSSGMKQDQPFDFEGEHLWLADEFRDVLPATVQE